MLQTTGPDGLNLIPERWETALKLAEQICLQRKVPALSFLVARGEFTTGVQAFGRRTLAESGPPVGTDAIYLVASITKPVVAMAATLLLEQGRLTLGDRVSDLLPGFGVEGKHSVKVRHLLTHTSGLPDMLPDNQSLRERHSPLSAFVEETCGLKPDFPAGRGVQYQSMGFAVLGEIIARVTGQSCAEFCRQELFEPLQMHDTVLGVPDAWFAGTAERIARIPEIDLPEVQRGTDWGWNERYWRQLGAPWGGMLTTVDDLARFARMMLNGGRVGDRQLISPAAIDQATTNRLREMPDVSAADTRQRPWGLGWRMHWPTHSANFGDLVGPRTYGHFGATGTMLWIDPDRDVLFLILTTQPMSSDMTHFTALSNAVVSAFA